MNWFEQLFGFTETDWESTQRQFSLDGRTLTSKANGVRWNIGEFSTPSLGELRGRARAHTEPSTLTHEVVGDALALHADPANAGAMFQAASQFNTLEFPGPDVTPEAGITGYAHDMTQGPACALATAPATVFRNYFAPVDGGIGQRADRQINNLRDLEASLPGGHYWAVRNGYVDADPEALKCFNAQLEELDREQLKAALRIGIQSQADVVFASRYAPLKPTHTVSQAYCSALSCGYSRATNDLWEPLARLVLEAAYEATLLAAAIERDTGHGTGVVWLTLLGGGVFGNDSTWIADAIRTALERSQHLALDIRLAHFRRMDERYQQI